ncbi:MAG: sulfotransferase [Candidatus Tectomicrobia bacterium]|nr:sulfotransferase [Candidatus Tectomicrobia bacterium]
MDGFLEFYEQSKQKDLFIILGSQGAGTNLLARFLVNVFDFSVIRDKALIFKAAIKVHRDHSAANIQRQLRRVYAETFPNAVTKVVYKQHHGKPFVGVDKYFEQANITTAKEFAYFFYAYSAYVAGKRHFAIKSDDIWEAIDALDTIFDCRKILLLTRDFRDNVLSVMHKNFGPRNVYSGSRYVKKRHNLYYNAYLRNPNHSLSVNYESLLTEPRQFIHAFADTFDMPPSMPVEAAIQKLNLRSSNFKKWEREMSPEELLICESIMHDELKRFDYALKNGTFIRFSPSQALGHRMHDCVLRVPQKAKTTFQKLFTD